MLHVRIMEDGDDDNAHTWRSLAWTAALLVRKLRNQAPERLAEAEAPASKSREETGQEAPQSDFRRAEASALGEKREAVRFK
jgi:hypothetical protein